MDTSGGVYYVDSSQTVHKMYISSGQWVDANLMASTQSGSATMPGTGVAVDANGDVFYVDPLQTIHQMYWHGTQFVDANLMASSGSGMQVSIAFLISGQITSGGAGLKGASIRFTGSTPAGATISQTTTTATMNGNAGEYWFLAAYGGAYTAVPFLSGYIFNPASMVFSGTGGNQTVNVASSPGGTASTAQSCSDISGTWTDGLYTYAISETYGSVTGTETMTPLPYGSIVWSLSGQTFDGSTFSMKVTNLVATGIEEGQVPDQEDDFTLTFPTCTSVTASLTNRVYGAGGSGSSFLGTGTPQSVNQSTTWSRATTPAPPSLGNTVTVVAWVDSSQVTIPTPQTAALPSQLGNLGTCAAYLLTWSTQPFGPPSFLTGAADISYVNNWLILHSATPQPPQHLDGYLSISAYRLCNSYSIAANGKPTSPGTPLIRWTPDPCGTSALAPPEQHPNNGYTATGTAVAQLAEGRLGTKGQAVNKILNGNTTPWIWSVIQFDSSGNLVLPVDHAMLPTYYIYWNNNLVLKCPQTSPSAFIAQNNSYQRLPGDIPAISQPTSPTSTGLTACHN